MLCVLVAAYSALEYRDRSRRARGEYVTIIAKPEHERGGHVVTNGRTPGERERTPDRVYTEERGGGQSRHFGQC